MRKIIRRKFESDGSTTLTIQSCFKVMYDRDILEYKSVTLEVKLKPDKVSLLSKYFVTNGCNYYTETPSDEYLMVKAKEAFPNAIIENVSGISNGIKRDGKTYNIVSDVVVRISNGIQYSRSRKIGMISDI